VDWGLVGAILGNLEQQLRESRISFRVSGSPRRLVIEPLADCRDDNLEEEGQCYARARVVTALPLSGSR